MAVVKIEMVTRNERGERSENSTILTGSGRGWQVWGEEIFITIA